MVASLVLNCPTLHTVQIDAFSPRPFEGNPAAVALLEGPAVSLSDVTRQQIAAENNLSETAFLEPVSAAWQATLSLGW